MYQDVNHNDRRGRLLRGQVSTGLGFRAPACLGSDKQARFKHKAAFPFPSLKVNLSPYPPGQYPPLSISIGILIVVLIESLIVGRVDF